MEKRRSPSGKPFKGDRLLFAIILFKIMVFVEQKVACPQLNDGNSLYLYISVLWEFSHLDR